MHCEHIAKCEKCDKEICSYCVEDCSGCQLETCKECYDKHLAICKRCSTMLCKTEIIGDICPICDMKNAN